MKREYCLSWLALLTFGGLALQGQVLTDYDFSGINAAIPDGDLSGMANVQSVSSSQPVIQNITVTLNIVGTGQGAFNGDLFGYVEHNGQIGILLNRVGVTAGDQAGYADNGFANVTFADAAANGDVHQYQLLLTPSANGPLTGTWAPDGRNVSPLTVSDATPRTALLSGFNGQDPNGHWTLFLADGQAGGTAQLQSWSLGITAVPEPTSIGLAASMLLFGFALWRTNQGRRQPKDSTSCRGRC